MTWLYLALLAQLVFAVVFVIEAFLVKTAIRSPQAITYLIGTVGVGAFLLLFWFPSVPAVPELALDLAIGGVIVGALLGFFTLLFKFEASRAVPIVGAFVGIWTVVLDILFRGESFGVAQFGAMALLVLGGFLLAYDVKAKKISWRLSLLAVGVGFLFALQFVLSKMAFDAQGFWEATIWIRGGSFLTVLAWPLIATFRKDFVKTIKKLKWKSALLLVGDQALGGAAYLIQTWAINLKNPSLVNATQGTQYVFLIILVALVQRKTKALRESMDRTTLLLKLFAIAIIVCGIVLLFAPEGGLSFF